VYLLSDCPQKQCAGFEDGNYYLHLPIDAGLLGAFLFSIIKNCIITVQKLIIEIKINLKLYYSNITIKSTGNDRHINLLVTETLFHPVCIDILRLRKLTITGQHSKADHLIQYSTMKPLCDCFIFPKILKIDQRISANKCQTL